MASGVKGRLGPCTRWFLRVAELLGGHDIFTAIDEANRELPQSYPFTPLECIAFFEHWTPDIGDDVLTRELVLEARRAIDNAVNAVIDRMRVYFAGLHLPEWADGAALIAILLPRRRTRYGTATYTIYHYVKPIKPTKGGWYTSLRWRSLDKPPEPLKKLHGLLYSSDGALIYTPDSGEVALGAISFSKGSRIELSFSVRRLKSELKKLIFDRPRELGEIARGLGVKV